MTTIRTVATALAAAGLAVAVPATGAAQVRDAAQADRQFAETGRWLGRAGEAIGLATEGFQELSQRMQALAASRPSKAQAMAAAPGIRKLIAACRASILRSNAALDALGPAPEGIEFPTSPRQLVADARAQNGRLLALVDNYDVFLGALASGDTQAIGRALPKILEGAFALIGHQRIIIRNRQAAVPEKDAAHQAIGIAGQVYRGMDAVVRNWLAAREGGPSGAGKAAAALGAELRLVARESRALAEAGRANLRRELAEMQEMRSRARGSEARLLDRVGRAAAIDEKIFALGDRLAAFAEGNADITGAQLLATGQASLLAEMVAMESSYAASAQEQASLLAESP